MKAISLRHGQAQVVYDRCIACGLCVSACPQKAKTVRSRVDDVLAWLKKGDKVVVSLAPSFPAAFCELDPPQVLAGLSRAGFIAIEETAAAARDVASHYQTLFAKARPSHTISSCCPVIVNLVEMYYPELVPDLAPSVSPMIWHSHMLHKRYPAAKIVFIGPCAGKIQEATRVASHVEAVLTFRQLRELWNKLEIDVAALEPATFNSHHGVPRLYPLSRGILSSCKLPGDDSVDVISVSGIETCMATFRDLRKGLINAKFIEALACREGCIGGTEIPCGVSLMARRSAVLRYHQSCLVASATSESVNQHRPATKLPHYKFSTRQPDYKEPTQEAIESKIGRAHV